MFVHLEEYILPKYEQNPNFCTNSNPCSNIMLLQREV